MSQVIDRAFNERTDVPRILAFWAALHYLSAFLLQSDIKINIKGLTLLPDFWSIALAPSGAGKTFTQNTIAKSLAGDIKIFPDVASAAAFAEALSENNKGIWLRDEFAQFLKQINIQPSLAQVKDYMLRTYDNNKIERITRQDSFVIEKPALTIFGTTPIATIKNYLTAEDLVDGFAQRFTFIYAERENKPLIPFYDMAEDIRKINELWSKVTQDGFHQIYTVDEKGINAYSEAFRTVTELCVLNGIDASFSRRIMWKSTKFALLFHIILGEKGNIISERAFLYAIKLIAMNVRDLRKLLDLYEESDVKAVAQKVLTFIQRKHKATGQKVSKRTIVAGVRAVKSTKALQDILELLIQEDKSIKNMIE